VIQRYRNQPESHGENNYKTPKKNKQALLKGMTDRASSIDWVQPSASLT
jgi:hypothetical protein